MQACDSETGEVLITLPGTSVQAYDVDFNAVITCCLASTYWISFHICLNQVIALMSYVIDMLSSRLLRTIDFSILPLLCPDDEQMCC
jgi:hypothetical protein